MPVIAQSSYHPPRFLTNPHVQTILPSYMRKRENVDYQRECFNTPDGDFLYLDWSRCGSDCLLILNHGLCGHSRRHYILSMVKAFNDIGWDCLAWNYRGTSIYDSRLLKFTTNNSTDELDWVTRHAITSGHYRKVAFTGYSMGGNLCLLYLGREAKNLPAEVAGAAVFCAAIDLKASAEVMETPVGRLYAKHFLSQMCRMITQKHAYYPDKIDLSHISKIETFGDFDKYYTVPLMGFASPEDYWRQASAFNWLDDIAVPTLMVNPRNDPFLAGNCFPEDKAAKSQYLYLEMPESGGHCGFITPGLDQEWWPTMRAKEFIAGLV